MLQNLYIWNTRWRCLQTSVVPPGYDVDDPYRFLCRYVKWFRTYCNSWQTSKWRTRGSANPVRMDILQFGMTQGIHRHQEHNFLTNCSKVISQNVIFWYLTTHRWRCSQLWHGPSDHGVDEEYQVSFRLIKVWPR